MNLALIRQVRKDLERAPRPAYSLLIKATRNIVRAMDRQGSETAISYGFDCHRQMLRAPGLVGFVAWLLDDNMHLRTDFSRYLRSGLETNAEVAYRELRIGLGFLLDGLSGVFDGTLEDDEDTFAFAYERILRLLDSPNSGIGSILDVVPRSLPLYRSFMADDFSSEPYESWAVETVAAIRRAMRIWID